MIFQQYFLTCLSHASYLEQHDLLDDDAAPAASPFEAVLGAQSAGAVVLDTRDAVDFAGGYLRGSVNVRLGGALPSSPATFSIPPATS
jgi:hypothetical protein